MNKRLWIKVAVIVCIGVILDILAHLLAPQITTSVANVLPPSIFVKLGLSLPVLLAYFLVTFGVMAMVFVILQPNLSYSRVMKGVWYGLSFGGLWYIGVLESSLVLGTTVKHELIMGLADALPILIMGTLLGIFAGTAQTSHLRRGKATIFAIPCIAFCYLIGRYFEYIVLGIDSGITVNPTGTFLWTSGMGIWIGIIYWLLAQGLKYTSAIKRAVVFSFVVYGSDWILFTFFLPVLNEMNLTDLFMRSVIDVLFVLIGVFVIEKLKDKS